MTRSRCLHNIGRSLRVAGKPYAKWTVVKDPVPKHEFKKTCSVCFPRCYPFVKVIGDETKLGDLVEGMPAPLEEDGQSFSS